jgi:hypothetical protein
MSLNHSPSVVTNGLIMYYDMNNTRKSWLGAPVTNYIANPYASHNGSSFVNFGYNYPNLGATYTYVAGVDNPINSPGVLEYYTGTSGYKYFSIDSQTLPTTGTYTFSYYARLKISGSASNKPIDNQLWRANGSDRSVTGDWNPTFTSDWVRYSTTGPAEASTILQYFPAHSGSIIGGYTIQYCGFQLELGSVATPFVVGTRSNTQAVVDLMGTTTLTATGLTYASNNTFSFGGTAPNVINNTSSTLFNRVNGDAMTVVAWIKPGRNSGQYQVITANRSDSAYNWMLYQHATDGSIQLHGSAQNKSSYIPTLNTWVCIIATVSNAGNSLLYANGVLQQTVTAYTYNTATPSNFSIGMFGSASEPFLGSISVVQVYNRALSAGEVAQNFNALRGRYGV